MYFQYSPAQKGRSPPTTSRASAPRTRPGRPTRAATPHRATASRPSAARTSRPSSTGAAPSRPAATEDSSPLGGALAALGAFLYRLPPPAGASMTDILLVETPGDLALIAARAAGAAPPGGRRRGQRPPRLPRRPCAPSSSLARGRGHRRRRRRHHRRPRRAARVPARGGGPESKVLPRSHLRCPPPRRGGRAARACPRHLGRRAPARLHRHRPLRAPRLRARRRPRQGSPSSTTGPGAPSRPPSATTWPATSATSSPSTIAWPSGPRRSTSPPRSPTSAPTSSTPRSAPPRDGRPGYVRIKGAAALDSPGAGHPSPPLPGPRRGGLLRRRAALQGGEQRDPPRAGPQATARSVRARGRARGHRGHGRAVADRWLHAVAAGLDDGDVPPADLPLFAPVVPDRESFTRRRAWEARVSAWRKAEASVRGVDPQAVLPGHCASDLVDALLAHASPAGADLEAAIARIPGLARAAATVTPAPSWRSPPRRHDPPDRGGHDGGDPQTPGPAGHDGGDPQTPGAAGHDGETPRPPARPVTTGETPNPPAQPQTTVPAR